MRERWIISGYSRGKSLLQRALAAHAAFLGQNVAIVAPTPRQAAREALKVVDLATQYGPMAGSIRAYPNEKPIIGNDHRPEPQEEPK